MRKILGSCVFLFFLLALAACGGNEEITITFNTNGGSEIDQIVIDVDTTTIDLPTTEKEGFIFEGWYFDQALTTPFAISGLLTNQNPTLYAKWGDGGAETFTITFDSRGGTEVAPILIAPGQSITRPADPTKEGYTFSGWTVDLTGGVIYPFAVMPESNVLLYATWELIIVETSTITFDSNGGSQVVPYNEEVGVTISSPVNPVKTGYVFVGWFSDQALSSSYVFSTMPTQDLVLYAKWNVAEYTLSFETDGGSDITNILVDYQTSITMPAEPTKEGFTFTGWYSDQALTTLFEFSTMPAHDVVLYASWVEALADIQVNVYLETLSQDGYDLNTSENIRRTIGTTYTHIPEVITGFTFDDSEASNIVEITVADVEINFINVYYQRNTSTITYNTNGGTEVSSSIGLYEDVIAPFAQPSKLGYDFDGWYIDQALTLSYTDTTYPSIDTTVYAKWSAERSRISFDTMGGEEISDLLAFTGESITLPTPVKSGYEFIGWYTSETYDELFTDTIMPAQSQTVYASWQAIQYSITYDEVGGSTVLDESHTYLFDLTEPIAPTKTDYAFVGWFSEDSYDNLFLFDLMPAQDIVLYAKWIDASNPTSIAFITSQPVDTQVSISGIVYATHTDTHLGFYIYDDTDYVFVNGDFTSLDINDLVSLDGDIAFDGHVVYIDNVSNIVVQASDQIPRQAKELSFEDAISLNSPSAYMINDLYKAEGIVVEYNDVFRILDPVTYETIGIYVPSYFYDRFSELFNEVNQRVNFTYVLVYQPYGMQAFSEYQIGIVDVVSNPYTETEKLDNIENYLLNNVIQLTYEERDSFELPTNDLLNWLTIEYEAVGENASFYDPISHMFLDIDETIVIDFDITLTSTLDPLATLTFSISVTVNPIITNTIDELINGDSQTSYLLDVIVVAMSDPYMQIMILKDETGLIYADHRGLLQIGDRVIIRAIKQIRGEEVFLSYENDGLEIIERISKENEIDMSAQSMTIEELLALDTNDPNTYGQYVELRGYLVQYNEKYHSFNDLVDGENKVHVASFTEQGFEKMMYYGNIEVYIKGYTAYSEDGVIILYEGIREDIRIPEYTDQELVDVIKQCLIYMIDHMEIEAFTEFPLYPYHPVLGASATWVLSETTEQYYDYENEAFTYSLDDVDLEFSVTITQGDAVASITFNKTLKKIEFSDIEDLIDYGNYGSHYVTGVIAYWHPSYSYIVNDANQMILVNGYLDGVRKGDEVILYADWNYDYLASVYLVQPYGQDSMVIDVLSHDNDVIYTYETHDMLTLLDLDTTDLNVFSQFIEIEGKITLDYNTGEIKLSTIDGVIIIECPDTMTRSELIMHSGELVHLKGVLSKYNQSSKKLVVKFFGQAQDLEVLEYTDQEKSVIARAFIQARYQVPMVGGIDFDFYMVEGLFDNGSAAFNKLDDVDEMISIHYGHINTVTDILVVQIEVSTYYGSVNDTFNITMTILPEPEAAPITSIEDAILDNTSDMTIRGLIYAISGTTDNNYIFMMKDDSGSIRVKITNSMYYQNTDYGYYGYLGDTFEVTGTTYLVDGYYQMDAISFIPYERNADLDMSFTAYTVTQILNLDVLDDTIYGQSVRIQGTIVKEEGSLTDQYYLVDGQNRVLLTSQYTYTSIFEDYIGYQVELNGFIFGSNDIYDSNELAIVVNTYTYDTVDHISIYGYSDQEVVDLVIEKIIDQHDQENMIYRKGDELGLAYIPSPFNEAYPSLTLDNTVISGEAFIEQGWYSYIALYTEQDEVVEINVEVTLNSITRQIVLTYEIDGYSYSSFEDLFTIEEGTQEIALRAVVLQTGLHYYYFLIENKVYYLEEYTYNWVQSGYEVDIIGKKTVIDGKAEYTYDVRMTEDDYVGFEMASVDATLEELYTNDYDVIPYQEYYLSVYGRVGYDPYLDMFTLTDQGRTIYVRVEKERAADSLAESMDYYAYVKGYLAYGKTVRGNMLVLDFEQTGSEVYLDLFPKQEAVEHVTMLIGEYYDHTSYYSGDYLNFLIEDNHFGTFITYTLSNPLDAMYLDAEDRITGIVDEAIDIQLVATITDGDDENFTEDITFTITLLPKEEIAMKDAYREEGKDSIQTTGVIKEMIYNDQSYLVAIVIEDGVDELLININRNRIFDSANFMLHLGDEISVVGMIGGHDYVSTYMDICHAIKIISSDQDYTKTAVVYTFDEIMDLDYLNLDNILNYIEVTGTLIWDESDYSVQSTLIYVDEGYGSYYYDIELVLSDLLDYGIDLSTSVGNTVTVSGYMWLRSINSYFDWQIAVNNIIVATPS